VVEDRLGNHVMDDELRPSVLHLRAYDRGRTTGSAEGNTPPPNILRSADCRDVNVAHESQPPQERNRLRASDNEVNTSK
jgi:hypothetical protein